MIADMDRARSISVEEHALGFVMLCGDGFEHLRGIDRACFTSSFRQALFDSMARVDKAGIKPGFLAVDDDMMQRPEYDSEMKIYLASLIDGSVHMDMIETRQILLTRLAARVLFEKLSSLQAEMEAGAAVGSVAAKLLRAAQAALPSKGNSSSVEDVFADIERYQSGDTPAFLSFGLLALDEFGPGRDELVVIGARPSVGKTTLAINLADRLVKRGEQVLFVSMESSATAIQTRRLSLMSGVPVRVLKTNGSLSSSQWGRVAQCMEEMKGQPVRVVDGVFDAVELCSEIRAAKIEHGISSVFIDHIGKVRLDGRGNKAHELGQVTNNLAAIAKELGIVVFALSQLNRAVESREDKSPMQADLRDSGEIEQDADHIWMLHRPGCYSQDAGDGFDVIVAKNRDGARGVASLRFSASTYRIYE